jgi:hypothetical protein
VSDSTHVIEFSYAPKGRGSFDVKNGRLALVNDDENDRRVIVFDIFGREIYNKPCELAAKCELSSDGKLLFVKKEPPCLDGEKLYPAEVHDIENDSIYSPFDEMPYFECLSSGKYYYGGYYSIFFKNIHGDSLGQILRNGENIKLFEVNDSLLCQIGRQYMSFYRLPEFTYLYSKLFNMKIFDRNLSLYVNDRKNGIFVSHGPDSLQFYDIALDSFFNIYEFPQARGYFSPIIGPLCSKNNFTILSGVAIGMVNRYTKLMSFTIFTKADSGYVSHTEKMSLPREEFVIASRHRYQEGNLIYLHSPADRNYAGIIYGLLVKLPEEPGGDIIMAKNDGILVPYGDDKFASFMFQYPDIHSLKVEYLSLPQD